MKIARDIIINAPVDYVRKVVAHDFANVVELDFAKSLSYEAVRQRLKNVPKPWQKKMCVSRRRWLRNSDND